MMLCDTFPRRLEEKVSTFLTVTGTYIYTHIWIFLKCSVKHMVFVTKVLNSLLFKKNKKLNVDERKQPYLILLTHCVP